MSINKRFFKNIFFKVKNKFKFINSSRISTGVPRSFSILRFIGNSGIFLGYVLIVYGGLLELGLIIRLISGLMTWPYYIRRGLNDLIVLSLLFSIIDLLALLKLIF